MIYEHILFEPNMYMYIYIFNELKNLVKVLNTIVYYKYRRRRCSAYIPTHRENFLKYN